MLIQIKKLLILDTYRLKNLILISIFLSIIYFCQLFLRQKISLNLFLLLTVLFIINYFCYFLYLSLEKEKKYFPLYPLIIFYYLITYSAYFYFELKLFCVSFADCAASISFSLVVSYYC